jgi:hypothetical protein
MKYSSSGTAVNALHASKDFGGSNDAVGMRIGVAFGNKEHFTVPGEPFNLSVDKEPVFSAE